MKNGSWQMVYNIAWSYGLDFLTKRFCYRPRNEGCLILFFSLYLHLRPQYGVFAP